MKSQYLIGSFIFAFLFWFLFVPKGHENHFKPIKVQPNQIYELKTDGILVVQIIQEMSENKILIKTQVWEGENLRMLSEEYVTQDKVEYVKNIQFQEAYEKYKQIKKEKEL